VSAQTNGEKLFDLTFNLMTAWNQIGFLLGSLVCFGLAALLLGWGISRRLKGQRIDGEIIGVRNKSGFYYPVWRFMLPSGEMREATSHVGTGGSARGMETGKRVPLLVDPVNPDDAENANNCLAEIIGLILLVPGALFLRGVLAVGPVTPATWLLGAAFIAWGAVKIRKHIIPKDQRASSAQAWMAQKKAERRTELANIPVTRMEDIVLTPEQTTQQAQEKRTSLWAPPILILAGIGLAATCFYLARDTARLEGEGLRAGGTVVALDSHWSSRSRGGGSYTYYPLVDFTDKGGHTVHFRGNTGSSTPSYRPGEAVTVLYLENNPQKSAVIDGGVWNWLGTVLTGILSFFFICAGVAIMRNRPDNKAL
jgi:hypothetical protein